jgi:hypothetical protein
MVCHWTISKNPLVHSGAEPNKSSISSVPKAFYIMFTPFSHDVSSGGIVVMPIDKPQTCL